MVKLALISDIHGNYKALEAFLAYIGKHPVDGVICLGDYVTDAPYPERIMEMIYRMREAYDGYMVRGNREDYLLDNADNHENWRPSSVNGALFYTSQHLTGKDMSFFAALPAERELQIENLPLLYLCHGVPGRTRGNVTQEEGLRDRALESLAGVGAEGASGGEKESVSYGRGPDYLLGGHSHHQEIYRRQGKTYINPGALGLAIDGVGGRAQFAVLTGRTGAEALGKKWSGGRPVCSMDGFLGEELPERTKGEWEARFLSLPYDLKGYLRDFAESGLDEIGMFWSKAVRKTLSTGINYCFDSIGIMEERAQRAGRSSFAQMPEEEWRKLEEELGL